MHRTQPWLIAGQGLAGTCLAFEFLDRDILFRIIDPNTGGSTRVAAGLLNPITGKNFEPSWRIEDFYPCSIAFFKKIESSLGAKLWHDMPILRLASSEKEWSKISSKLSHPKIRPWLHTEQTPTPPSFYGSITLNGGGWIDTPQFLKITREYFLKLGIIETGKLDSQIPNTILCQGSDGLIPNQLGPHRCAKGEILTVIADWPETHIRIGAGGWLIPIGDNHFRIGSTYEWNHLDNLPTKTGVERISAIAEKLGGNDFKIIDHLAGIRPILRRSQPLIGKDSSGNWIFNALGSKGTLYAPEMANMLAAWICENKMPHQDFIYSPS